VNLLTIFTEAAQAIGVLAAAGAPVPPGLVSIVTKVTPALGSLPVTARPPNNASALVTDIVTAVGSISPASTGLAAADASIAKIIAELEQYAAWKSNLESGQAAIDGTMTYVKNGIPTKMILVSLLEGGAAAAALGL
jgi:hypothetical protein